MKQIKCEMCGKIFLTAKPNKKYCSFSCKEAGNKLKRIKWKEKNPHYNADYMKEYRKKERKGE